MSAVDLAVQKVKNLDEAQAIRLMEWLRSVEAAVGDASSAKGARAMLGFARRFRAPRTTAQWMAELREGEAG